MLTSATPSRTHGLLPLALLAALAGCGGGGSSPNTAPIADAGAAQSAIARATVTLDGSASRDADNDALTYAWTFTSRPANSVAQLLGASSAKPTFVPDVAGTYSGTLVVNDGKVNSSPASFTVTVAANGPATVLVALSGDNQALLQHQRAAGFQVRVQDALGNPVPGISVTFSAPVTTPFNPPITVASFTDGVATATPGDADAWIRFFHVTGAQQIIASAPGLPSLTFRINVTATSHAYDGRYYCNNAELASSPLIVSNGTPSSDGGLSGTLDEGTGMLNLSSGGGLYKTRYTGQILVDATGHAALAGSYGLYLGTDPAGPATAWSCNRL